MSMRIERRRGCCRIQIEPRRYQSRVILCWVEVGPKSMLPASVSAKSAPSPSWPVRRRWWLAAIAPRIVESVVRRSAAPVARVARRTAAVSWRAHIGRRWWNHV